MKRTFIVTAMLTLSLGIMAAPARRGQWRTITLADGTEVRAELLGDENVSFWQTEDGRRFVRNTGTGRYVAADIDSLKAKATERRAALTLDGGGQSTRTRAAGTRAAGAAYTGEKKGLVILVEFPDMPFTAGSRELYERVINEQDYSDSGLGFVGSVRDYFSDQSLGVFDLTFDIAGPVMMPEGYATYGGDSPYQDANVATMLRYALNAVDDDVDYTRYDWDGDGQVEQVFFIYAGLGQANGGDDNTIWPHKSAVINEAGTGYITLDGVRIYDYACSCELQPVYGVQGGQVVITGTRIDGIGTICHEYSHCLGLADLYDVDYSGAYGMNSWDLMSSGNYNGDGYLPPCYTGFERMQIGWEEPVELTEDTEVSALESIEQGGGFYVVRNDGNPGGSPVYSGEYYVLENRQLSGRWDAGLPGEGLLITHVDYNESAWTNNVPNDNPSHQRCTPIPADNNFYTSTQNVGGDAWPYNGNNSLTNSSTPAAAVYTKNTDGTYYMNKSVTDITQNSDGIISFSFSVIDNTPLFYESFDNCSGLGGNDGTFINMGVNPVGKGAFNTDNEGWTGDGGGASKCALFTSTGTTPEFTIGGDAVLTFSAAPLITGVAGPVITVTLNGNAEPAVTQADMTTGSFTDYSINISGTGSISITFSSNTSFFLDEVRVLGSVTTGISNAVTSQESQASPSDGRIYSIDGRYVGTDVSRLGKGLYIRGGKKFVKQ